MLVPVLIRAYADLFWVTVACSRFGEGNHKAAVYKGPIPPTPRPHLTDFLIPGQLFSPKIPGQTGSPTKPPVLFVADMKGRNNGKILLYLAGVYSIRATLYSRDVEGSPALLFLPRTAAGRFPRKFRNSWFNPQSLLAVFTTCIPSELVLLFKPMASPPRH